MATTDVVMYDEEFNQIKTILSKLRTDANAKLVFLVDKNGQQIAAHGNIDNLDTTSLASLTAGNVAATDALAKLIGEKEFSVLFHEGERDNIHISIVGLRVILVVIFDERSSLGSGPTPREEGVSRPERRLRQHHAEGGSGEGALGRELRVPVRRNHR